ncbi:unnamed protein product [Menidia menidia]|uniref:Transcription factor IIIB 50 kDa subunit n=1 Tax=Menidia menidia TaxID=238744 RepID=A0A8S4ANY5_9TELE|nr:unnamed protein product [Menidia menidia]
MDMSRAGLSCPGCGSSNIVDDDLYSQAQLVCVDCGSVVSEGTLANEPYGGIEVSYLRTTAVKKRLCANLIKGLERVKELARLLRVRGEIEDLALTYFKQAYEHENFIKVSLQRKEVLAGCCVLLSCRQQNWPVTLGTIGCLLSVDQMVVGALYQEMLKVLNITAPIFNVTDVIESHCQEYKISSLHVPEEMAESSEDLTKRAVALVELAADSWIVTGRQPLPIMMAAIYLAWQSLNPNKHRIKLSLDKFCQMAKVQRHRPALTRVAELKQVLCKLGKEIPWVSERVTPENVLLQVGDILEYRYALLRRALRTHADALEAEGLNTPTGETANPETSERGGQSPDASAVEACAPSAERAEHGGGGDANPDSLSAQSDPQSQDPAANWGKRMLFAPPCVLHAKRRRAEQPELHVTGDEEISDSEIESYIRSPQEVRDFALTQQKLSSPDA